MSCSHCRWYYFSYHYAHVVIDCLFFVILFDRRKDQFAVVASISYLYICLKDSYMFQTSRPFTTGSSIWNSFFLGFLISFQAILWVFLYIRGISEGFHDVSPFSPLRHYKSGVRPGGRTTDRNSKTFIKLSEKTNILL